MSQDQQSNSTEEQTQQKADQQKATQAAPAQRAAYADSARPEDEDLAQLKQKADRSNAVTNLQALQRKANESGRVHQLKSTAAALNEATTKGDGPVQRAENNTGLPDNLKSGIESLSGYSMDDVKVHRNSDKPAQLQAHAYAQGTDIHLGPGQEKHLPHEAWHVVQQKQGRVKPTMQMKGKVNVNDDAGLEKEADLMGTRVHSSPSAQLALISQNTKGRVVQRAISAGEESSINASLSKPREKDRDDGIYPDEAEAVKKRLNEAREQDVILRLKSFGGPFPQLVEPGGGWHGADVTWDFKHWMADGEMPPDYGYGFPVRTYYKGLDQGDRNKFTTKCKGMKSATNITRILAQYTLTSTAISALSDYNRNCYNHTRGILDETKNADSSIGKARLQELMSNPKTALTELTDGVIMNANQASNGGDSSGLRSIELSLANVSDEIWKEVARVESSEAFRATKEFPPKHQLFGAELMDIGNKVDKILKGGVFGDIKAEVLRVFGKVIRSWGDATASIGYDPKGKMITQSQSSTTDDYGRIGGGQGNGDGKKAMTEHKENLDKEGENTWCDMFASGSMWSLAANYDRYRDTVVTLYVQPDHGAQLGRGKPEDPFKLRVTAAELQLGVLNFFFTDFKETKDIGERAPLDARSMRDEERDGTKGLPNTQDAPKQGDADEVARDLGSMRIMGDGSMQFWVKTEGDGDWYKATPDGDRLKVDYQTTR